MADFEISGTGAVTSSTAKGLDEALSACVAGVIESIQFPAPGEGSVVQAHFPLEFHPASN